MGIHFSSKKRQRSPLHFQPTSKPFKSIRTNETSFYTKVKIDSSEAEADSDYISPLRTLNSKANVWSPENKEFDKKKLSSLMESLGINVNQKTSSQFRISKKISWERESRNEDENKRKKNKKEIDVLNRNSSEKKIQILNKIQDLNINSSLIMTTSNADAISDTDYLVSNYFKYIDNLKETEKKNIGEMFLFNENNRKATDFFVNKIKNEIRLPKSHQADLAADRSGKFAQSSRNDIDIFRKEIEKMKIIKNSQNKYNLRLKAFSNNENSHMDINNNSEFRISKRPQQIIRNNKQLLKFKNKVIEIVDEDEISKRVGTNQADFQEILKFGQVPTEYMITQKSINSYF